MGSLTPAASQFLRNEIGKTKERLSSKFPQFLPLLEEGGVYDFLEGKTSEQALIARFKESLINPVVLASMVTDPDLVALIDLSKILWAHMDDLAEILPRLILSLVESQRNVGTEGYPIIRSMALDQFRSAEFRTAVAWRFSGIHVAADELDQMLGIRLLVYVFSQYILEKMGAYANPNRSSFGAVPKLKRSDMGDLLHVVYCPYVDLFGCDAAMRDRIRRAGWPITNVLVDDAEIEARLARVVATR